HFNTVPYLMHLFGREFVLGGGNIIIMLCMLALILLFPLALLRRGGKFIRVDAYLAGANIKGGTAFIGAMQAEHTVSMKNYYMEEFFGESKLFKTGAIISLIFILAAGVGAKFLW
ncbi:MAG: hypothetical protein PHC61_14815, partial [Chitinivibrionales bacterium]|nr:hypothetical protein [Chitinivibrionales bacterium]